MPGKKFLSHVVLLFTLLPAISIAQNIAVNQWRVHLPYRNVITVTEGDNKVYAASREGMFVYNMADGSVERMSKTNGFSDVEISVLRYYADKKLLMVAYRNTNIDILGEDNSIINLSDIFRKSVIGEKKINHIYFNGNFAYVSGTFGISVIDLTKNEVKETYLSEDSSGSITINASTIYNNYLYAATPKGILRASLNIPNLIPIGNWEYLQAGKNVKHLATFNNKLYADIDSEVVVFDSISWSSVNGDFKRFTASLEVCYNKLIVAQDTLVIVDENGQLTKRRNISPNYEIMDKNGDLWTGKNHYGLVRMNPSGQEDYFSPNGPFSVNASDFANFGNEMWLSTFNLHSTNYAQGYSGEGFAKFDNQSWSYFNPSNGFLPDSIQDINSVVINQITGKKYFGSFLKGLVELTDNGYTLYDANNSSLERWNNLDRVSVAGMAFDDSSNLWIANFKAENNPIAVKRHDGSWKSYSIGSLKTPTDNRLMSPLVDEFSQKWFIAPGVGIVVFDEKKPPAQQLKLLTMDKGAGSLPSSGVLCMAEDDDGEIWVGTVKGLTVFSNPGSVLTNAVDAHQIQIGKGANTEYLLGTEQINAIKVDGGDRKWVATRNGVWLFSSDGQQVINFFNIQNSPLLSNNVTSIGINQESGEVFFGTEKGIISFRGTATAGADAESKVYAFPNPVKPGYEGPITIQGLVKNANVKITDVTGGLIFETYAEGGTATWDGRNFGGDKAHSGVYLVFSTNPDGSQTFVTKILIVN
jgi:hypothetical protein